MLSKRQLNISAHPAIVFGNGSIAQLAQHVRSVGYERAFVVTDPGIKRSGVLEGIATVLTDNDIGMYVFDAVAPNPTTACIEQGSAALRMHGDALVVAVGGGSAIDAAKGIALHVENSHVSPAELDYRNPVKHPARPVIAVPTTAGTGSETNTFGVITNPAVGRKFYVGDASVQPRVALLDPSLTLGLPPSATAATGFDAFTHAMEALTSRNANPYADGLALHVLQMVAAWLPRVVADGSDLEARSQMLLAAHLAGVAFRTTGLGLCHGLGHALGARLGAPHGLTLAIMLPHVMRFNLPVSGSRYAQAALAMGAGDTHRSDAANAEVAIIAVEELSRAIGTECQLRDIGCTAELIPTLAADAIDDEVTVNTPRVPTFAEAQELLLTAL